MSNPYLEDAPTVAESNPYLEDAPDSGQSRLASAANAFMQGGGVATGQTIQGAERLLRPSSLLGMPEGFEVVGGVDDRIRSEVARRRSLTPEQNQAEIQASRLYRAGEALAEGAKEAYPTNPKFKGEFWADTIPSSAGAMVPTIAAAGAGGVVAGGLQYGLSAGQSEAQSAIDAGREDQADKAFLINLGIGATSEALLGVGANIFRLVRAARTARVGAETAKKIIGKAIAKGSSREALQEGFEQVGQNAAAGMTYDPERGIWVGVPTAMAAGALLGGAAGGGASVVGVGEQALSERAAERNFARQSESIANRQALEATIPSGAAVVTPESDGNADTMRGIARTFNASKSNPYMADEPISQSQAPSSSDVLITADSTEQQTSGAVQATSPAPGASTKTEVASQLEGMLKATEPKLTPEQAAAPATKGDLANMVTELQAALKGNQLAPKASTPAVVASVTPAKPAEIEVLPPEKTLKQEAFDTSSYSPEELAAFEKWQRSVFGDDSIDATPAAAKLESSPPQGTVTTPSQQLTERNPGDVTAQELIALSDADARKFFESNQKRGNATQYDAVLAGMKLDTSAVPGLEQMRDAAQKAALNAIMRGDDTASFANQGRVVWLNGAIEGANRKGPNFDLVNKKQSSTVQGTGTTPGQVEQTTLPSPVTPEQITAGDWIEYVDSYGKTQQGKVDAIYNTAAIVPSRAGVQVRGKRTEYYVVDASGKPMTAPAQGTSPKKIAKPDTRSAPLKELQNQVTGAIERGEGEPIVAQDAPRIEDARKPKVVVEQATDYQPPEMAVSKATGFDAKAGYKFKAVATSNQGGFLAIDGKGQTEAEAIFEAKRAFDAAWKKRNAKRGNETPTQTPTAPTATDAKMAAILAKREELKARLRKKLGQQTNLGVDPEVATIAAELAVNYAQEGVVKFGDFARRVKADLPEIWDSLKQYLRGAWATATDISDNLEDVSRDEAKSIISDIDKPSTEAEIKPEASDDTKPDISETSEGGTNPDESGRNEPAGPPTASDSADVAGSLPQADAGSKRGKRTGTGGKRSGSSIVAGGAKDAGGILGSPAAGGAGTNPTQPGDGSSISQPDNSVGRENYWLKDPASIVGGGPKARFKKNQQAIETVQRLIAENKEPNPQDLDVLAAYTGWGAFGQELFNGAWNDPAPKPSWEKEDAWLREHLGEADWKSAQTSIINAHYTDPITVSTIWRAIERMGFKGGRVLEPSVGIGNFFSLMPREVMRNSVLTGIELEQLTGRIAKMLHPKASISIKGYQDSLTADNFYDLVLGNWPFADVKPADRRYNHFSPVLHDYFFLKALDQVRPGGLVVGITSTGTMDKANPTVRRYLAARGELIASFRLPAGTFGDYAGTAVVTDLVILRKRETKLENSTDDWIDTVELELKGGKIRLNKYYQTNPAQIIGTLGFGSGSTKGRAGMMVIAPPNHQEAMEAIATRVPADVFKPWMRPEGKVTMIQGVPASSRQFAIIQKDGDLYQVQGEQLALLHDLKKWKVSGAAATKNRMSEAVGAIAIRDSYDAMMDTYRKGGDVDAARKQMAAAYAGFKKKHGLVRGSKMIEVMERAGDSGMTSVLNLEDESGKPRAILEQNILRKKVPGAASSIEDAYAIQRNRSVHFSVQDVSEIAKRSEADVISKLTELNQIYKAPDGTWQARDEYLSDNVRRKLREAQAAQEQGLDMARNIEALQAVQPKDTPYFEIDVRMGANWVSHDDYKDFVVHLIKTQTKYITIERQSTGWRVKVNDDVATQSPEATTLWGIPQTSFKRLLNAAMNGTSVVVKVKDSDGNLVPSQAFTEEANGKIDAIREEFQKWIWQDSERIARLSNEYNEAANSMVAPDRDGSHLMLEGLALTLGRGEFDFRKHQKDAVWRGVQDGKGMFGHEVGTGKTFTMAGLAMEGRRLGVFRKPLIFAHNANHSSVVADFRKAYPAGKFLHLDSLSPQERSAKLRQIVLDDWDAIVVPHSLIDRFTLREETLNELAAKEIQALEDEVLAELADAGQSPPSRDILDDPKEFARWAGRKEGMTTAKQLVKARARIKERIRKKAQEASKEGAVFFEDLGVDAIFVDEAHIFKKIALATRKEIKGLNKAESGIGFSLSLLTDYVKSRNAGKGTFLFTGTPITNTLNEAYNMMKYVMSSDMADAGIERFDDWFNLFADAATEVEMNDAGIYEAVERLRAFINVPELARMAGRYFDIVLGKDMPEFKPRASDEGMTENPEGRPRKQIKPVILEMSKMQLEHLENIRTRYRAWMNADGKARREIMLEGKDGPLQLSTEASLSALDYRLIDRFATDWEGSKANAVVGNISTIYHESPDTTQMVFMEQGFNDFTDRLKTRKDENGKPITDADGNVIKDKERVIKFNVLRDMVEKLQAKGIPPEQVAVFANMSLDPIAMRPNDILRRVVRVTGAVSKEDISQMMRDKSVRVAFGQTETMGTGVNAQDYLRAMHHVDAPWMPGSHEQRNGRGWRQGNKWNTVIEHRYTVEGSGDGKRWQVLLNKVRFITRFIELLNGEGKGERTLEGDGADASDETDSVASFEATFSAAAGDPRQMLRVALEKKVKNLEIKRSNHFSATWQAGNKVKQIQSDNESGGKLVAKLTKDLEAYRAQVAGKPFEFEIEGTTYTDRDLADAALKATPLQNAITQMGALGPFKLYLYKDYSHYMEGPSGVRYDMGTRSIASAEATLRSIVTKLENKIAEINRSRESISGLQTMADTPFSGAEKLDSLKRALDQIETEIQASPFPVPSWIRTTAPQGSLFYLKGTDGKLVSHDVAAHRWDENGWWILYMDAKQEMRPVDYSKVLDEAGRPIFEPVKFVAPPDAGPAAAIGVGRMVEWTDDRGTVFIGKVQSTHHDQSMVFVDWAGRAIEVATSKLRPHKKQSEPVAAVTAAEPSESAMDYEGGEMPRESSFMDWLDQMIARTDFDQTKTLEGVLSAPVWMTKGGLNVALRAVRLAIKAGKSLAEAIRAGVAALKAKNLKGFNEAETISFLESETRKLSKPSKLPKNDQTQPEKTKPFQKNLIQRALSQVVRGASAPKAFVEARERGLSDQKYIEENIRLALDDLRSAINAEFKTKAEQDQANERLLSFLNGEADASTIGGPIIQLRATEIRKAIDDLSAMAVSEGLVSGQMAETWLNNSGEWLKRTYLAFDSTSDWNYDTLKRRKDKGDVEVSRIWDNIENYLQRQNPNMDDGQIEAEMRSLINRQEVEDALGMSPRQMGGTGKRIAVDTTSLLRRKNLSPEVREWMGEIKDPYAKVLQSGKWLAQFITRNLTQRRFARIGLEMGVLSETKTGVFTEQLYESERVFTPERDEEGEARTTEEGEQIGSYRTRVDRQHEPLSGYYTTPEFKAALDEFDAKMNNILGVLDFQSVVGRTFMGITNYQKGALVAWNPASWGVNTLGGLVNRMAASMYSPIVFTQNLARAYSAVRRGNKAEGFKTIPERFASLGGLIDVNATHRNLVARADYLLATRTGLVGKGIMLGDVQANTRQEVGKQVTRRAIKAIKDILSDPKAGGAYVRLRQAISDFWRTPGEIGIRFYDDVFRVSAFFDELHLAKKAHPEMSFNEQVEWAADRASNIYQNYDRLPKIIRDASRVGALNTFVSFKAEVFRNAWWIGKYAKDGMGSTNAELKADGYRKAAALTTMTLAPFALAALMRGLKDVDDEEDKALKRWIVAPWDRSDDLAYVSVDGTKYGYVPMGYIFPTFELSRPGYSIWNAVNDPNPDEAIINAASGWAADYVGPGAVIGPLAEGAFNIRIGQRRPLTMAEGSRGVADRLGYVAENFTPRAFRMGQEAYRAATGQSGDFGREYSFSEIGAKLAGLRQRTVDVEKAAPYVLRGLAARFNNATTYQNQNERKSVVKGVEASAYEKETKEDLKALYKQALKDLQMLGVPEPKLRSMEKAAAIPVDLRGWSAESPARK